MVPHRQEGSSPRWVAATVTGREQAYEARQVACARYTREGFAAAAVTALVLMASGLPEPRQGVIRTAALHFDGPHAVVATATVDLDAPDAGPWTGLPVFSAWITDAAQVSAGTG